MDRWCGPTATTGRTCSGRSAAEAAASAWSRRSSSRSFPSGRCMRATSSGRSSAPARSCTPGAPGSTVPDELTSLGRILHPPPLPQIPEPFRGRSFVGVEAAFIGDEPQGRELLEPLRQLGPEIDTVATIAPPELAALHMDPPEPAPAIGDGALLDAFPAAAVDEIVDVAGADSGTALLTLEIRQLGGALARPAPDAGAAGALDAAFALFGAGMATPGRSDAVKRASTESTKRSGRGKPAGRSST